MGRCIIKVIFLLFVVCAFNPIDSKSLRIKRDRSYVEFPPARGGFNRNAVESSPVVIPKSAALRDLMGHEEFGTRALPLRAAVESVPPKHERIQAASHRIPARDAVEQRPPAYDDDLFALTDELESLGIDPWSLSEKPGKKPDKYQEEQHMHHYVIQLPEKEREQYTQKGHDAEETMRLRNGYYGAAKPYNQHGVAMPYFDAYHQVQRHSNRFSIDNPFQQLINAPLYSQPFIPNYDAYRGRSMKDSQGKSQLMVCYVESWANYRKSPMAFSPGSVPPLCTHVVYAFATLHPETFTMMSNDNEYDIVQGGYRTVTGLKRQQPDLKVLISVGGDRWSGVKRFSQVSASKLKRTDFIRSAIEFCRTHGFDGLDLHWQYPGAEDYGGSAIDKKNLISLLKEMKDAFDPMGLTITMSVPGSRFRIEDGYDAKSIQKYVEWISLEAFDFRADRESCSIADHHSPLYKRPRDEVSTDVFYNVDYAVKYWIKSGMPANKIVLSIPAFGRSYKLENATNSMPGSRAAGLGEEGEYTQTKGLMAYFEICDAALSDVWTKRLDEAGSPYMVRGDQWIGYDDMQSIQKKVAYVKKMNLAGGALWAVDMDDFRGLCGKPWPLLTALSNGLQDMPVNDVEKETKTLGSCDDHEEGFMSDPHNCATYILCRKNVKYQLSCPEGTLYDSKSTFCRVMDPSNCLPGQSVKSLMSEEYQAMNPMDHTQQYYQYKGTKNSGGKRMVCYVTNWSFYRKGDGKFVPEHVDPRLCTHIIYAYASLDPDKLIAKEFDPWADIDNNLYSRITALSDSKVLLGLGGWTDSAGDKYSRLVSSPSARKNFVTNLIMFLRTHRFQGLHFDWNYPKCWQSNCAKGPTTDKANFAALMQEISREFKRQTPMMELGVALSGYREVIDAAYDLPSVCQSADFCSAMTYDYHGGWEPTTSHGSPLYARPGDKYPQYTADSAIQYILSKGVPSEKLLLGLAFYGQSYQLGDSRVRRAFGPGSTAVGPGSPGDSTRQPGMLSYYEVCYRVKSLRWQTGMQDGAGPYAYNKDQWVGYEDPTSITEKVSYAMSKNLGGVVGWTIDLDDFNNLCCTEPFPLLRAANRALGRTVPNPPRTPCERPAPPVTPAPPITTTIFESGAASTTQSWQQSSSSQTWWSPESTTAISTTTTRRSTTTRAPTTRTTTVRSTTTRTTPAYVQTTSSGERCSAGTYYADPTDCTAYFQCVGGEKKKQPCAPGLHWNAEKNICDWPAVAKCDKRFSDPLPPPSTTTRRTTMHHHPTHQMTHRPTHTPSHHQTHQPTRPSHHQTHHPTHPSHHVTQPAKDPTIMPSRKPTMHPHKPCENGAYYAHSDCRKFNVCVNNRFVVNYCAPGLVWIQSQTMCNYNIGNPCPNKASLKNVPSPLRAACVDGTFAPYPGDCTKYQMCQWKIFEAHSCAAGLHWNTNLNICDWPSSAKCTVKPQTVPDGPVEPSYEPPFETQSSTTTSTTYRPWTTSMTSTSAPSWSEGPWRPPRPVVPTTTEDPTLAPLSGEYKIVCYFTNWAWYRSGVGKYIPEDIDHQKCTHIVYGFCVLDSQNLIIKAHDSWADTDNYFYERVTAYKKKGLKVLLALGGWNDSLGDKYSRLVNNPAARARFIEHALKFLQEHNFDGLDLDWEYPTCWQTDCKKGPDTDKAAFTAWVRELSAAFQPRGLLLSTAVSASKTIIDAGYDVPQISKYFDWIAVMAYDYHGQWDKKTGHVAPLYYHPDDDVHYFNANYSMHYWISEGAPPKKLVMGMPLYGQSFTLGTSWDTPSHLLANKGGHGLNVPARAGGQAGAYTKSAGFLSYYEICDRIHNQGWIVEQDEEGRMGPHAYKGDQWVSYDDVAIIKKKSEFVKSLGLGGAMIWALDLDDFRNNCGEGRHPLLTAIREVLNNGAPPKPIEYPVEDEEEDTLQEIPHGMEPVEEPQAPPVEAVEAEVNPVESGETEGGSEESGESGEESGETGGSSEIEGGNESEVGEEEANDENRSYKMICYFTNWAWYRQGVGKYLPSDIDPSLCSHILYGFAVLDTQNLIIKPHDSWADIDNKFYEKVTAYKARGIKVLLALGGWNDSAGDKYSRLVNNPSARRRFVLQALDFVQTYKFDGLDLDWEYPTCWQVDCTKGPASDKEGFSALVRELHEVFSPKNLLLSAAVSPNRKVIDAGYDVPALSKYLDWIAVMTYDYHGQWDKKTGHVAPMYAHPEDDDKTFNANYTIHHWIANGADRTKLMMGLSLYGQSFSLASSDQNGLNAPTYGGGEAGEETRARGFLSYYEICDRIKNKQWTVVRDSRGRMGPYAYKGDQWVSFDDIDMIRHKTMYIKAMGLGGGMIWALDLDDFRANCGCENYPLLRAASRELGLVASKQPYCPLESDVGIAGPSERPTIDITTSRPSEIATQQPMMPGVTPFGMPCQGKLFAADPMDCNSYYFCINGIFLPQHCPASLYWNAVMDHCDWPANSNCKPGAIGTTAASVPVSTAMVTTTQASTDRPTSVTVSQIGRSGTKIVCYFTNWAWYRRGEGKYTPEDIEADLCTHIVYGFAVLDSIHLTITPHDSWADIDNDFYGRVTALKAKGKKVLIAIGGWNDSLGNKYSRLVNDPAARARFVTHVVEFIEKWHFDGLDLDWEYPRCWQVDCDAGPASDKEGFASLVNELRHAFAPRNWLISAAVSASKAVIDVAYDVPSLSRDLDFISVMTYDFHGHWDRKTGHVAPLFYYPGDTYDYFNTNYSINYWIESGASPSKIIMGMPMYGQSFTLVETMERKLNAPASGPGEAGEFTRAPGFLAYNEICYKVKHNGWAVDRDPEERVGPWARRGTQWVSFDDTRMIAKKTEMVRSMELGGAMIWALDLDDFQNRCGCGRYPLLKTIRAVLNSQSAPTCDL